jgi:S1-C subfamily serine protease
MIAQSGGATVALMMYRDDKDTTLTTGYRPFCTGVWVDDTHILTADHCAKAEQEHQQDRLDERKQKEADGPMTLQQMLQKLFGGGMMSEAEPDKIEEKGLVVHFITENEVIEVGKEPSAWHMSKVVAFDEKHDLALLEAVGKAVPSHRVAKLAKATPEVGETVHIVGQTIGMYWTYIQGNVSAYRGKDMVKGKDSEGPWMQVSSPMFYGNSGGGAFNDYGELVGIADWIKRAPEMGFFVHLDTIRSFLDSNLSNDKK